MENRITVDLVVVAAVVVADLRPEGCRLLVLLEALAEVMGMLVEAKEVNHILKAPQQQMLLKIVPLGRTMICLTPSIFHFFFVLLQTGFSLFLSLFLVLMTLSMQLKLMVIVSFFINVPLQIVCNAFFYQYSPSRFNSDRHAFA